MEVCLSLALAGRQSTGYKAQLQAFWAQAPLQQAPGRSGPSVAVTSDCMWTFFFTGSSWWPEGQVMAGEKHPQATPLLHCDMKENIEENMNLILSMYYYCSLQSYYIYLHSTYLPT